MCTKKTDNNRTCHVRRTGHRTPETHRFPPRQLGTICSDCNGWCYLVQEGSRMGKEQRRNHRIFTGKRLNKLRPSLPAPSLSEMLTEEIVIQGSDIRSAASDGAFKRTCLDQPRRYYYLRRKTDNYYPSSPSFNFLPVNCYSFFMYACMHTCIHIWMDVPRING